MANNCVPCPSELRAELDRWWINSLDEVVKLRAILDKSVDPFENSKYVGQRLSSVRSFICNRGQLLTAVSM